MEASIGLNLRVTTHSNQGGRKYMEDMTCVAYKPTLDEQGLVYAYFGIFDGHGGPEAAKYAQQHLMNYIVSQKNFWSPDDELVKKAISDGFLATHYAMWKELDHWPKTTLGFPSTAGTTASIVFVRRGKLYVGHVGDSGIALGLEDPGSNFWLAKRLTVEHKPDSPLENARIAQSGGKVMTKTYSRTPRVVWNRPRPGQEGPVRRSTHFEEIPLLATSRSLGDLWSYNSLRNEFVVSPLPDVSVIEIDADIHRCIILGSDGLWNWLNHQEAVHSVYYAERNDEGHKFNPSERLVDRALDRWLHHPNICVVADNISVVTVLIDPSGPSKAQVLGHLNLNGTHVIRQSVSSVTNPATSGTRNRKQKTVPAMVLATNSGKKSALVRSQRSCPRVSSSTGSRRKPRLAVSGSAGSKSCSSLSLQSEAKSNYSVVECKSESAVLRRRIIGSTGVFENRNTHQQPSARQSSVSGHPKEMRKTLKNGRISPILHTKPLRRVRAATTPVVKDVFRRRKPSLRRSKGHEDPEIRSFPGALAKSTLISTSAGEFGRNLGSGIPIDVIQRVTRSMKK